ncbi:hypothetical protein ACTA71_007760 [Dictyostelium dimigraforme]
MKLISNSIEIGNDKLFFKVWRNIVIRRRISKFIKESFCELFMEISRLYQDYCFFLKLYSKCLFFNFEYRTFFNKSIIQLYYLKNNKIKFVPIVQFKQLKEINNSRNKNSKYQTKNNHSKRNNKSIRL